MGVSRQTLAHPVLTLIVFVLLGIMGLFTIRNIAISLFPDIDAPYIMVMTTYRNAGPESVEKSVTQVLESSLVSVGGLKEMTSTSSESSSMVVLEFNYGTNLEAAVNDVRDKLDRVKNALPTDASTPSIFKMDASAMPIMRIAVRGNRSSDDLKEIAEDSISDILEQADGVAEVNVMGGRQKIVRVEVAENRLAAYGLTISAVSAALARQNLELSGGKIVEGRRNYIIRTTGEFSSVNQINDTVITTVNGYNVRVSDIGSVFLGNEDITSVVYINGEPGVYLAVTKQSGSNSVAVADAVYKKIEQVRQTLPEDITLEIIGDDTTMIRDIIKTLVTSAVQGLVLAVIILFIFLQNFKSTFIIAISIPLSILITVMCMYFAGITLNMMTLTGLILGIGMIVDASVVMIENIYVYRTRGAKPKISAILGSQEMIMSVVSGNLTTICVFLPFLFFINKLEIMGQLFKGIIFTIVIALLSSLFVAVFLVPVLAGKFLPLSNRAEKPVKNRVLKRLYGGFQRVLDVVTHAYRHALNAALDNRAVTLVISFSLFVIALVLLPTLRINLFGNDGGDDSVTLNVTMPLGTTLEETVSVVRRFEAIAQKEVVGYESITSSIGNRGRQGGSNSGTLQIQLPVASKQIDTSETIQQKLRAHFTEFADARFTFSAGWSRQMSGSDISIELRSKDLEAAVSVANKFKDVMETIGDIGEVSIDTEEGLPEVEIVIDRARAAQFGVDITTVATEISAAMNGTTATVYRTGGKEYDVKVMYRPEDREKMSDLSSIYVNGTGGMVTVSNFASLKRGLGPVSIRRTNQTRIVKVSANILTGENANVVEGRIKEAAADHFVVPDAVSVTYAGSWSTTRRQGGVYGSIALMALILVFGVMAGTYESFKAPIINMMTIPFLLIGVVAIYKLTGQAMSMTSMVGVIMLIGIVVNNGIILVDYTNLLRDRGYAMREACLEAGVSRLRPVLMTTLTTILGTLPMCFQSEGSAAMVQPIGMAIVGGLTSSTFVTLFFIPVFYSILMRRKNRSAAQLPAEIAEIAQSHDFPAGDGEVQMEIIANQSVEDDIVELLEQAVPDIRYTIIPTVTGRGKHDYKLGTTTWPERNFMLVAYLGREHVAMVQAAITFLKKRFPKEGIKLFVTGTER